MSDFLNVSLGVLRNDLMGTYVNGANVLYDRNGGKVVVLYEKNSKVVYKTKAEEQIKKFIKNLRDKINEQINNLNEVEKTEKISTIIDEIVVEINRGIPCVIKSLGISLDIPCILTAKLQNGKITERTFGTKENGQRYTPEEVKVILKEAEEIECDEKFKDKRLDKFTFLSMIVNMDNELVGNNSRNPIRFIKPDNKDKDKTYKEICNIVKQAKQDYPNDAPPNILLIPYSADGHIVTLLVDKNKFPESNSVICFDSSHYFGGYTGWIKEHFGSESKPFKEKHFSFELYGKLKDNKKPINDKIIQGLESTCSFYTEAFCYLISKYMQDKKNEGVDLNLNDISNHINSKEFTKQLKKKKKEFFKQYKATMKEIEQKQEQQKQKIKKEIIKYKEQNSSENGQLTSDERHYQQLLNQYGICMYGQEFMNDINSINNSNPLNPNQQNALVREFIGSDVITRLNGGREIIVGFNHNREAFINTVYDAQQPNNVLNNGTAVPVNFIYTLGTENNQNADAGTHYVAGQIFRDPITNELVVLHYDSLNGTISDEFEQYIRNEFGRDIQIVNISNKSKFTQQQGTNTCGLCALTALRNGGILDQERIKRCHLSKDDINLNTHNTPQQTPIQSQLSENLKNLNIKVSNVPLQRDQYQPSCRTPQTLPPPPPPTPRSPSPSISGSNG